jgi:hypothetical protein
MTSIFVDFVHQPAATAIGRRLSVQKASITTCVRKGAFEVRASLSSEQREM